MKLLAVKAARHHLASTFRTARNRSRSLSAPVSLPVFLFLAHIHSFVIPFLRRPDRLHKEAALLRSCMQSTCTHLPIARVRGHYARSYHALASRPASAQWPSQWRIRPILFYPTTNESSLPWHSRSAEPVPAKY
ncbi:hypothetical protein GQ53DRAFT_223429 [Thozetella sp. PMI_491]|nr:hypothetical protein GQ53DRAFT_223429 [Thozetella sp. PMI_491]